MSVFVTLLKTCKVGQNLLLSLMDIWNWEMRYDLDDRLKFNRVNRAEDVYLKENLSTSMPHIMLKKRRILALCKSA